MSGLTEIVSFQVRQGCAGCEKTGVQMSEDGGQISAHTRVWAVQLRNTTPRVAKAPVWLRRGLIEIGKIGVTIDRARQPQDDLSNEGPRQHHAQGGRHPRHTAVQQTATARTTTSC